MRGAVQPELRLVRYFVAVAEEESFTRAARRLGMAQPPLSTAIRQLEAQLGVRLLDRSDRRVRTTPAGAVLLARGRVLLAMADEAFAEVRAVEGQAAGLLKVGISPAARFGLTPRLLAAWGASAPSVMVHMREDTTGALLRDLAAGRLDLAVVFCPPPADGIDARLLLEEPAVLHVRDDHRLADRPSVDIADLAGEIVLVAGGPDSPGYTATVMALCREAGIVPEVRPDPYPDLGLQAVREGLGVVVYVRTAFDGALEGSRLVPVATPASLPFHICRREGASDPALDLLTAIAFEVAGPDGAPAPGADAAAP